MEGKLNKCVIGVMKSIFSYFDLNVYFVIVLFLINFSRNVMINLIN